MWEVNTYYSAIESQIRHELHLLAPTFKIRQNLLVHSSDSSCPILWFVVFFPS